MSDNAGFRKSFFRWPNLRVVFLLITLSLCLGHFVWVLQYPGVVLMQAIDEKKSPKRATHTVLVTITPDEYKEQFAGKSPLDAGRLMHSIETILKLEPPVLAVDIDTADTSFQQFAAAYLKPDCRVGNTKLIWARGAVPKITGSKTEFVPGGFLGQEQYPLCAGIAGFGRDADWAIRKLNTTIKMNGERIATFHRAICLAGARTAGQCNVDDINVPLLAFPSLTLTEAEEAAANSERGAWKDRIVILGGLYSATDYHPGSARLVPGIELVASAVEAQLDHKAIHPWLAFIFKISKKVVMEFLAGMCVAWIFYRKLSQFRKQMFGLGFAILMLFLGGVLWYWYGLQVNPFVVVVGMLIHQWYETAHIAAKSDSSGGGPPPPAAAAAA